MTRNNRLNKIQMRHDFTHAFFAFPDKLQNLQPDRIGEGIKDAGFEPVWVFCFGRHTAKENIAIFKY